MLTLLEVVEQFVEFRREVVRRRIEFELRKAEGAAHILEGPAIALDNLDAVITLIRGSKNPPEAKAGLIAQFGLSEIQAQAILDMQLQRLTGLERQKILDELAELMELIAKLRDILASERLLCRSSSTSCATCRALRRRPAPHDILDEEGELSIEDLIADEDVAITVTDTGYIKRTPISTYRNQKPRRQGPHRHADARRGRGQPPVRGVDALLHDGLLGSRPRLLAEGPRDPGRRRRRRGQGDREPGADGGRREDGGDAAGPGVRRPALRRDGHAQRARSRRPSSRRSATRAPAASSPWASKTTTR